MTAPTTAPPTTAPTPTQGRAPSAAQLAQILVLIEAQGRVRDQLTRTAVIAVSAQIRAFTRWWDGKAVDELVGRILRIVAPIQVQVARVTDGYLARVLTVMTGHTVRPVGAVDVAKLRHVLPDDVLHALATGRIVPHVVQLGDTHDGPASSIDEPLRSLLPDTHTPTPLDPAVAYGRIAESYRYQVIAQGLGEEQAQAKAVARAAEVTDANMTLANRAQTQRFYDANPQVDGYRRVLHPERGQGGPPCGLCVVAADRTYKRGDLLPIHGRCRCETVPIVAGVDPGISLNRDELNAIYAAAGGTGARGLKKIRVAMTQHGEVGPVLIDAGQRFRGPADVAKATVPDRRIRAQAQLAALEESLGDLYARQARGEDVTAPIDWQTHTVDALRRELASIG